MYSIGEFSRLTGLSIKALRLYHEMGILVPVVDADSGYRYYREKMVQKARAVRMLKELAFSLAEVATIVTDFDDDQDAIKLLESKRAELEDKIAGLEVKARSLTGIISREREAMSIAQQNSFEVEEKVTDTFLYAGKRWQGRYEDCDKIFPKLFKAFGFQVAGKPFNLYYDEGCMDDGNADIETCVPIRKGQSTSEFEVKQMPSAKCLSLIHQGPYHAVGASYQKLFDYMKAHGLKAQLPYREVYVKGPGMIFKGNPANYLTEIQIQI